MNNNNLTEHDAVGIWYGVLAYTAWGILPLYWKLLNVVPAMEILAHRIVWSFVFVGAILILTGGWQKLLLVIQNKKNLLYLFLCGFLISLNWFTYIWAVNSNHVIEASMGYYINPLVVVLLGVVVLKEKLTRWQGIAILLATAGVLIITLQYGRIPWVALILAATFALYGLSKKLIKVDSITGLALETMVVMPLALYFIITRQTQGIGSLGRIPFQTALILCGSGIVTATPLLWFAMGAQKVKLTMMGFLQYIAPTLSLLLGIFVFKEYFSALHFISFSFIWAGLLIFIVENVGMARQIKAEKALIKQQSQESVI
ncbi:MAG: EamA family transporter RarD [Bacillota bacterium]|nr:EamA family transporter RarD [Bacillota bacterium]MDW7683555.1 EamA family transporter RarD [Bacillota bacterium]